MTVEQRVRSTNQLSTTQYCTKMCAYHAPHSKSRTETVRNGAFTKSKGGDWLWPAELRHKGAPVHFMASVQCYIMVGSSASVPHCHTSHSTRSEQACAQLIHLQTSNRSKQRETEFPQQFSHRAQTNQHTRTNRMHAPQLHTCTAHHGIRSVGAGRKHKNNSNQNQFHALKEAQFLLGWLQTDRHHTDSRLCARKPTMVVSKRHRHSPIRRSTLAGRICIGSTDWMSLRSRVCACVCRFSCTSAYMTIYSEMPYKYILLSVHIVPTSVWSSNDIQKSSFLGWTQRLPKRPKQKFHFNQNRHWTLTTNIHDSSDFQAKTSVKPIARESPMQLKVPQCAEQTRRFAKEKCFFDKKKVQSMSSSPFCSVTAVSL